MASAAIQPSLCWLALLVCTLCTKDTFVTRRAHATRRWVCTQEPSPSKQPRLCTLWLGVVVGLRATDAQSHRKSTKGEDNQFAWPLKEEITLHTTTRFEERTMRRRSCGRRRRRQTGNSICGSLRFLPGDLNRSYFRRLLISCPGTALRLVICQVLRLNDEGGLLAITSSPWPLSNDQQPS